MKTKKTLRSTKQQRIVLEFLQSTETHPSAGEIFAEVRQHLPRISLATVYRNLTKLEEHGQIQSLEPIGGQRRFDGNSEPHLHIRCLGCDKVTDAETSFSPDDFLSDLCKNTEMKGFHIESYRFELFGSCSECREYQTAKTN